MPARKKSRRGFNLRKKPPSGCIEEPNFQVINQIGEASVRVGIGVRANTSILDNDSVIMDDRTTQNDNATPSQLTDIMEGSSGPLSTQSNINDSMGVTVGFFTHQYSEPDAYCRNCLRITTENVVLSHTAKSHIRFRKKFCFVKTSEGDETTLLLCDNCIRYLSVIETRWDDMWPIWMRTLLSDTIVLEHFVHELWKFLPASFRSAWLPFFSWKYHQYRRVTLTHPVPYFDDKTNSYKQAQSASKKVDYLKDVKKYIDSCCIHANIKCPWGCNEFLDDCGVVPYYFIVRRFLNGLCFNRLYDIHINDGRRVFCMDYAVGARPDFLSRETSCYLVDSGIMSTRGFVLVNGNPFILTCRKHNGGDCTRYIHPCMNPVCGVYPTLNSDHFAPVIVNMRSARTLQSHKYSTTYQVNRIHGGYNGIDSCDLTSASNFTTDEKKHWELLSLALYHRLDMPGHFSNLVANGVLSHSEMEDYKLIANQTYGISGNSVDNACSVQDAISGATFIATTDALKLELLYKKNHHHTTQIKRKTRTESATSNHETCCDRVTINTTDEDSGSDSDTHYDDIFFEDNERDDEPHHLDGLTETQSVGESCDFSTDYDSEDNDDSEDSDDSEDKDDIEDKDQRGTDESTMSSDYENSSILGLRHLMETSDPEDKNDQCIASESTVGAGSILGPINSTNTIAAEPLQPLHSKEFKSLTWKSPWPDTWIYVHTCDSFGWKPTLVPVLSRLYYKFAFIWILNSMASCISKIYENFVDTTSRSVGITPVGFYLSYFIRNVVPTIKQRSPSFCPYKAVTLAQLMHKLKKELIDDLQSFLMLVNDTDTFVVSNAIDVRRPDAFPYKNKSVIVFIREPGSYNENQYLDNLKIETDDGSFAYKCRYVARVDKDNSIDSKWSAIAAYRNHEDMFRQWWIVERNKLPYKASDFAKGRKTVVRRTRQRESYSPDDISGLPLDIRRRWNVLVLVQTNNSAIHDTRREYLISMGGQINAQCSKHDIPLVNSSSKTIKICCFKSHDNQNCNKKAHLQCPYGCLAYVCIYHAKLINSMNEKRFIEEREDEANLARNEDEDGQTTISPQDAIGSVLVDPFSFENERDHAYYADDESSSDEDEVLIPCTQYEERPHAEMVDNTLPNNETMRSHTLINSFGGALMRQGRKLKGTKAELGFMQKLVSQNGISIPLLYPEAMLFPSIFWKSNSDASIIGALPNHLWSSKKQCKLYNMTGAKEHYQCRLTNQSLLTSTDPRYLFHMVDVLSNINLRGFDCRITMKRGLESIFGDRGPTFVNNETVFDSQMYTCDVIDGRRSVNCLAAMLKEKACYFTTYTLNEKLHPGIKQLVDIRNRLIENACFLCTSEIEIQYTTKSITQASMTAIMRSWMKIMQHLVKHITESRTDMPYGRCIKSFGRFEFTEGDSKASGSFPHFHLILFIEEETEEIINSRIRCGTCQLGMPDDYEALIVQQILESPYDPDDVDAVAELQKAINSSDINNQLFEIRELASVIQTHDCEKVSFRCCRATEEGPKCRYTDHYKMNPKKNEHYTSAYTIKHSAEAESILLEIGMLRYNENQIIEPNHPLMCSEKYYYPADKNERFSPTHFLHFIFTRSNQNVVRTSYTMTAKYLAKYVASLDDNARLLISADQRNQDRMKLEVQELYNTKISSSAIVQKKKIEKQRPRSQIIGRLLSATQAVTLILDIQTVSCSEIFVNIPTVSLENRVGVIKSAGSYQKINSELTAEENLRSVMVHPPIPGVSIQSRTMPSVETRNHCGSWRQFTHSQQLIIADQLYSAVKIDSTSTFGIRPPELLFIDKQEDYLCHFVVKNIKKKDTTNNSTITAENIDFHCVYKSCWIDGVERQILLRRCSIQSLLDIYSAHENKYHTSAQQQMKKIFIIVLLALFETVHEREYNRLHLGDTLFVITQQQRVQLNNLKHDGNLLANYLLPLKKDSLGRRVAIPIYRPIKPSEPISFLMHILLSMGHFITEIDLWKHTTFRDMFISAQLLDGDQELESQINEILRKYICEQLMFTTSGKKVLDECIILAKNCLYGAIVSSNVPIEGIPACLYTSLRCQVTDTCRQLHKEFRFSVAEAAYDDNIIGVFQELSGAFVPSLLEIVGATKNEPLNWTPTISILEGQTEASYTEQKTVLQHTIHSIMCYANCCNAANILIHGGPGAGKSFIATKLMVLFAQSKGLTVMTTSLSAELSQELGGIHIHKLFQLKPFKKSNLYREADIAINKLYNSQLCYLYLIQTIDILVIDEMGMCSAELISVLDIILRYVRNSSHYMGGILVIGTFDIEQLNAIDGHPLVLSANVLTHYNFFDLQHFVRSRNCTKLQELQILCRKGQLSEDDITEFKNLIRQCNHVDSWKSKHITSDMMQIYGKRCAVNAALKTYVNRFVRGDVIKLKAIDEETARSSHDDWKPASLLSTNAINQNKSGIKEPETLVLYQNAILEFTCNRSNTWSQGQICIAREIPPLSHFAARGAAFSVYMAPVGTKRPPENLHNLQSDDLKSKGWKLIQLKRLTNKKKLSIKHLMARRTQFPVRSRVASTVHKIIGKTCGKIVTQISCRKNAKYALWSKEQLVVLVSRTEHLDDMTFVNPNGCEDTMQVMLVLFGKTSQYYHHARHIIRTKTLINRPAGEELPNVQLMHYNSFPFRIKDVDLPVNVVNGFVYILWSISNKNVTYIGETNNLIKRLQQHNRRFYNHSTDDSGEVTLNGGHNIRRDAPYEYSPWGLAGYVYGFAGDETHTWRKTFERQWQFHTADTIRNSTSMISIVEIISIGETIADKFVKEHQIDHPLTFVVCLSGETPE